MLVRLQRNQITLVLLVGMENGTTVLKSCLAVSHKTKSAITIQPTNCSPGHLSQRNENLTFIINLHMNVYGSFSHNNPKLEAARTSFTRWRVRHTVAHQTTEHCSAIRRNKPWRYTNSHVKQKESIPKGYRLLYIGFHSYTIFEMTKL